MRAPVSAKSPGAIVIGGDYRGLGLVRSLGRRGVPVCVITDEHTLAGLSRYAQRVLRWPRTIEEQLAFLLGLSGRNELGGWTVFPTTDETAAMLARNASSLAEKFTLTTPPWETLRWAYDKRLTYQLAAELSIPYPTTLYPRNREDVEFFNLDFPVILKPATKHEQSRFTREKAWRVENRTQALARYDQACEMIERSAIMVQDLIPGDGASQFSYAALCEEGLAIATITARRRRQYPIDFGHSSSYVESIEAPEVERLAQRLISEMRLSGLVEIEFKRDARDDQLKLLDINPRVWGWHTLGARAGVDFGYLAWQFYNGAEIVGKRALPGVRWIRGASDLLAIAQEMRRGQFSLRGYLSSLRPPLECAIWANDDLLPGVCELAALLGAHRRLQKGGARLTSPTAAVTADSHKAA